MSTEFGWWNRDPDRGKYQVRALYHGGAITWEHKQGHFTTWQPHPPTEADWDELMATAGRRVPRRLLSPRQFEAIRQLRDRAAS